MCCCLAGSHCTDWFAACVEVRATGPAFGLLFAVCLEVTQTVACLLLSDMSTDYTSHEVPIDEGLGS